MITITAFIFPYVNGKKVGTQDRGSFLEYVFVKNSRDHGEWISKGWQRDANEEFEFFDDDDNRFTSTREQAPP